MGIRTIPLFAVLALELIFRFPVRLNILHLHSPEDFYRRRICYASESVDRQMVWFEPFN